MGLFSKDIATMDDLFVHTLRDMYYAEDQIVKALPDMIEKATNAKLKQGLQTHLGETKNQIKRLERVFKLHDEEADEVAERGRRQERARRGPDRRRSGGRALRDD